MARKIKTQSPSVAGRAKLDLCKIDTARLRAMTPEQLETAISRVGKIYMLPKREHGYGSFRWLLSAFMSDLRKVLITPTTKRDTQYAENRYWPDGRAPKTDAEIEAALDHNKRMSKMYREEADHKERRIWDLQAQAGCKLRETEIVARDAERENKPEIAAEIRRSARRPPTPHKRPAKIR